MVRHARYATDGRYSPRIPGIDIETDERGLQMIELTDESLARSEKVRNRRKFREQWKKRKKPQRKKSKRKRAEESQEPTDGE